MTPNPAPPPGQQQPKTVLTVVLLLLFGGLACCSGLFAVGAYTAYQQQQGKDLFGKALADAGVKFTKTTKTTKPTVGDDDDTTPPDDEIGDPTAGLNADEEADKALFAADVIAQLKEDGHEGYRLDAKRFALVNDDGAVLQLGNLYDEYAALPEAKKDDYIRQAAQSLLPAEVPAGWSEAKSQVLTTVRERIFVELIGIQTGKTDQLVFKPLADDLVQVAVFDGANNMQFVTKKNLEDWGIDPDELFLEGKKNLVARSQKAFANPSPGVWESQWADNHDIARALLFDTIRKLKVKGDPVVFLPQRDHLVITGSDDDAGLDAVADLLDTYLALPRANGGRGWRLTKSGLEPFVPEPDTHLAELRQKAVAQDANDQKKALDAKFEKDGTDIFVGTTLFTEDDDGKPLTYAVWTKGADTLMPKADFVVFVDIDRPENQRVIAAGKWDDVFKLVGQKMKPDTSYWPLRYRLKTFPDAKAIKAIGLHPYFARNGGD
ncbi:MAG: hypothetical protein U0228_27960 [Myxococcaceae bacterium]